MTTTSFPFDNQSTSEAQYSYLFRELQSSGVCDTVGGPALAVTVGTAGTLTVNIAAGRAYLRGFMFSSDAVEVRTFASVPVGQTQRIDRVILRADPTANVVSLLVVPGTATAAPDLTQTDTGIYEESLATVTVRAGDTLSVVDTRRYVGHGVGAWTTTNRPALARKGKLGYNVTLNTWEWWNGSTWVNLLPVDTGWITCSLSSAFTGQLQARLRGGDVLLRTPNAISLKSNAAFSTDVVQFATLPLSSMSPPVYTRIALPGYGSTSSNGAVLAVNTNGMAIYVSRVGPSSASILLNGYAWSVD